MRTFGIFLFLVISVFGGEREVWYGADGKVVRVIEDGEPVKKDFKPQWERREAEEERRAGVIRWDRGSSVSRRGYSRVYPIYPNYWRGYSRGGYHHPRGRWHRSHGHGHGYRRGWSRWGWSGIRIRVGE